MTARPSIAEGQGTDNTQRDEFTCNDTAFARVVKAGSQGEMPHPVHGTSGMPSQSIATNSEATSVTIIPTPTLGAASCPVSPHNIQAAIKGHAMLHHEEVFLLCLPIGSYTRTAQFVATSAAVIFFFVVYGYFQELIFRLEGFRPFGWYLTLIQFAYYVLFGLIERHGSAASHSDQQRRIPWPTYLLLASLTVATMGLSNTAVGYLNYPTAVIFKCCKLIPVLVGGILIQGKSYGLLDISASVCMTTGLIFFTLADSEVSPNFNTYGVIIICLALCADAVIGNVQEQAMKQHKESNANMYPLQTYGYAAVFSATGYIGVHVVLTQVRLFGALIAVTVTSCRKALSIVLSFLVFAKPFTLTYLWSGLVVLLGIYLNIYSNNKPSVDAWLHRTFIKLSSKSDLAVFHRRDHADHVV